MLTLNGENFISENDQFILVSFFQENFFSLSFTQRQRKKLSRSVLHLKIFSAAKADAVPSITEFTESRMFAGMNNETPGLLQYTYTREMDISNYIQGRFHNLSPWSDLKEVQIKILPYFVLCTFRLIDNITKQIIFRSFMLNYRFLNLWD